MHGHDDYQNYELKLQIIKCPKAKFSCQITVKVAWVWWISNLWTKTTHNKVSQSKILKSNRIFKVLRPWINSWLVPKQFFNNLQLCFLNSSVSRTLKNDFYSYASEKVYGYDCHFIRFLENVYLRVKYQHFSFLTFLFQSLKINLLEISTSEKLNRWF